MQRRGHAASGPTPGVMSGRLVAHTLRVYGASIVMIETAYCARPPAYPMFAGAGWDLEADLPLGRQLRSAKQPDWYQLRGSIGAGGVPRASIASPARKHRSSRNLPATICTPTGVLPKSPVETVSPGKPSVGSARIRNCASQTRWNPDVPCRSSPSGKGSSPETGTNSTANFVRNVCHSRITVAR